MCFATPVRFELPRTTPSCRNVLCRAVLDMVAGMRPEDAEEIAQAATANANHIFRPGKRFT